MGSFARTYVTVRDALWQLVTDQLEYPRDNFVEESSRQGLHGEEKRNVHVALLAILTEMAKALESLTYESEVSALSAGASYAEIGSARGLSRQAIRQRHAKIAESMNKRRSIVLLGGPYDQQEMTVRDERSVEYGVSVYRGRDDDRGGGWYARYEQSRDDAHLFLFKEIRQAGST